MSNEREAIVHPHPVEARQGEASSREQSPITWVMTLDGSKVAQVHVEWIVGGVDKDPTSLESHRALLMNLVAERTRGLVEAGWVIGTVADGGADRVTSGLSAVSRELEKIRTLTGVLAGIQIRQTKNGPSGTLRWHLREAAFYAGVTRRQVSCAADSRLHVALPTRDLSERLDFILRLLDTAQAEIGSIEEDLQPPTRSDSTSE